MYDVYCAVRFMMDETELWKDWVLTGNSTEDPITSGKIQTPVKESTAQYHFTYSGWEGSYTNITDAVDIMAIFDTELRSYEICFYNIDSKNTNHLLEEQTLFYGEEIKYKGRTPEKLDVDYPQDYKFLGWITNLDDKVKEDLGTVVGPENYYAKFADSDHILDSWDTIAMNIRNGSYKTKYPLGVKQRVVLNYTTEDGKQIEDEAHLQLVAYDHDITGTGRHAAMTFIMDNILDVIYMMNESPALNNGGWAECKMRQYLINNILPGIPEEIRDLIVPVVKKASIGGSNKNPDAMNDVLDTIWLPSVIELTDNNTTPVVMAEGSTYAWFKSSPDVTDSELRNRRIKRNDAGTAKKYWLRTPANDSTNFYFSVSTAGGIIKTYTTYQQLGIVFGFCIGVVD
jgi:hypothetical protein